MSLIGKTTLLALICGAVAHAATSASLTPQSAPAPRIRIILVGDSTVTDRAGWGHGFKLFLGDRVDCINTAVGGRSSKSFIDEGKWADALALKGDYYLIQFGHNDQPGKGPERETDPRTTYRTYISRYVDEVRAIGGTPVLVTSLTRRNFEGKRINSTLTPYAEAVKALAAEKRVALIDLHAMSIQQAEAMGEAAWPVLSPRDAAGGVDRTHLNAKGSVLVAPLVVAALRRVVPDLAAHLLDRPMSGVAAARRNANATVAADGSGDYRTVQEAINAAPQTTSVDRPWIIYIKPGTYKEIVYVQREKRFVTLIGEDPATTTITYGLHANMIGADGKPIGTFRTPTVQIDADDFSAENLTFENSAGPVGQALAVRVDGDRVVFRNSRFLGWQDTIFVNRGRQYFGDSLIEGHVDFIFGGATSYFDRCSIHVLRDGYITAASTPPEQKYGFVFVNSRITGAAGAKSYLGRPWRDHAQVTFVDTMMSDVVRREGWHNWDKPPREATSRYIEVGSTGPGSAGAQRVGWAKRVMPDGESEISAVTVLRGTDGWDPERVPSYPSPTKAVDLPVTGSSAAPGDAVQVRVFPLWHEGVPNAKANAGQEQVVDGRVTNVQVPTITFYPPASPNIGTAIIVAPGGGYQRLAVEKEGSTLATHWNALGIAVFVLKYRLSEYGHPAPLQDVLRAIRMVRSRAAEFGVRPDRIGVFGSSAGGHLAASAGTLYSNAAGETGAALDRTSARPDFIALLYPVISMDGPSVHAGSRRNLLGADPAPALIELMSVERQVTNETPPTFLVHTAEDTSVPAENSLMFYQALRRAGVPVELHLYEKGPHGFGTAPGLGPTSEWPKRFEEWLRSRGLLDR